MKDQLHDALYRAGWAAVKRLPEPAANALGRKIADIAWRQRGKGVRRLESNLARVVPDATPEQLSALAHAGMRSYLRYWMESFRLPAWSKERIRTGFDPKYLHYLEEGLAAGKGVILALPHMGNYDLAGAWVTTKLGVPFTTVAERLKPETLYDRFVAYRESLGMEVLPHTGGAAFGTLARRLRSGGLVCLVADRDLSASGIEVRFFGDTARMPAGPAMLALQTGALLLPVTLWYDDTSILQGRVHPPIPLPQTGTRAEKAAMMTQAMADEFASGITEHPEHWHMLQRLWLADFVSDAHEQVERPASRDISRWRGGRSRPRSARAGDSDMNLPLLSGDTSRRRQGKGGTSGRSEANEEAGVRPDAAVPEIPVPGVLRPDSPGTEKS
ncbi:MAG: phosphatidylinositol mannoside acyltransferase [Streptomycetaceae bacterium]|nr:phosphatidylinositol mannoside acyltransferase [Streptomycetaceae bacterium]